MKKKFVAYFDRMEDVHLTKDVGLVPFYISKEFNLELEYVTADACKANEFRGVKIKKIKRLGSSSINLNFYLFLLKNKGKIDYLMTFHCRNYSLLLGLIYKALNPAGKFYIKMDLGNPFEFQGRLEPKNFKNLKTIVIFKFLKLSRLVDLFSAEINEVFEQLYANGIYQLDIKNKLTRIINGADDQYIELSGYKNKKIIIQKKENIFLTVGRIGDYVKNNELLLDSIKNIDLKNWKLIIVGPIKESFRKKIEEFENEYLYDKNKIEFLGGIYEREKIYEIYSKAKVFILTSRSEGFANVFSEARYFGNYIITTDVGGAEQILKDSKHGERIENSMDLSEKIAEIVEGTKNIDTEYILNNREEIAWSNIIRSNQKLREIFG